MRILLNRLPLFLGVFLLQVSPAVTSAPPSTLTDLLLQGLSQVPVYVILAYIVINIQRTTAKENERRDEHEKTITDLLGTQIKRVDAIEIDRKAVEKERNETYRILSSNLSDVGAIVKAYGIRTEFLIDEDKKTGDTLGNVELKVNSLYDRFAKVFPRDTSIDELFTELKNVLLETKKACEETKTKTGEIQHIEAQITLTQPPEEKPANPLEDVA